MANVVPEELASERIRTAIGKPLTLLTLPFSRIVVISTQCPEVLQIFHSCQWAQQLGNS